MIQHTSKIQLSAKETKQVCDTQWILTKHIIIQKVYEMFGLLNDLMKQKLNNTGGFLPGEVKNKSGKISKGENYKGLPYLMLDVPPLFEKENILAIRIMFWWGNFFSITLHVKGKFKAKSDIYQSNFLYLKENNFFVCVNENEWEHHFEDSNFKSANSLSQYEFKSACERSFIKIAKKIPLTEWDKAPEFLLKSFDEILQWLKINYQAGKTDPLPAIAKDDFDL